MPKLSSGDGACCSGFNELSVWVVLELELEWLVTCTKGCK